MHDNTSSIFHLKTRLRVISIIAPVFAFFLVLSLLCLFSLIFIPFTYSGSQYTTGYPFPLCITALFLFPLLFIILIGIFSVFTQTIPVFASYLKISGEGLEYKWWPTYHIRCSWDDVQAVEKRREITSNDVILLNQAVEVRPSLAMTIRKKLGMDTRYFIPLSTMQGWPTGKLADTLREYAPHLFSEGQNPDQETG